MDVIWTYVVEIVRDSCIRQIMMSLNIPLSVFLLPLPPLQAQLLEAKKQLETQNTLQQKTRELLRSSEQQVAALKSQLASASSTDGTTSSNMTTPTTRAAGLRAPLRGEGAIITYLCIDIESICEYLN